MKLLWRNAVKRPSCLTPLKRQTGICYIAYEDSGKRRWKSTRTKCKSEAIQAPTNFQKLTNPPPVRRTLAELTGEHRKYADAIYAKKTRQLYDNSLGQFHTIIGNRNLTSYTERDVENLKLKRMGQVSTTTVNT